MQLYKIDERLRSLMERMDEFIDDETGEVDPAFMEQVQGLGMEAKWKIEGIGVVCKELAGDAKMIGDEITRLKARKAGMENRKQWLINYVSDMMKSMGLGKHSSPQGLFTVYLQKNPDTVHIERPDALPKTFQRITVEPAKKMIKEAWDKGQLEDEIIGLAGIELITGQKKVRYK